MDIFKKVINKGGPLSQYRESADGYYMFPKLEGELSNKMMFMGRERLVWSLNNYLGLGNHPEVRKADADASTASPAYTTPPDFWNPIFGRKVWSALNYEENVFSIIPKHIINQIGPLDVRSLN